MKTLSLIVVIDAALRVAAVSQPDLPDDFNNTSGQPGQTVVQQTPEIKFSAASQATAARLPRALLIVGQNCSPCERIIRENPDLVGGPEAPVEIVRNWLANDLDELGITPGMIAGTPTLVILQADGSVHRLEPSGVGCKLYGYHTPQQLRAWLTVDEHGVSLEPSTESLTAAVTCEVRNADPVPSAVIAALSAHLSADLLEPEDRPEFGSLFQVDFDAPDGALRFMSQLLAAQKIELPAAGLTVSWAGDSRTVTAKPNRFDISPPVNVSLKRFGVSVSTGLSGIAYTEGLRSITLELDRAPDLTVNFR